MSDNKFLYLVSSNIDYYERTLPILLGSLKRANIENVLIYVGGSKTEYEIVYFGYVCKFVAHNSYEYTSLIQFVLNPIECQFIFLLHDTCEVDIDFKCKVEAINESFDVNYLTNIYVGVCNIAMFKYEYLLSQKDFLCGLVNCSKTKAIQVETKLITNSRNIICYPNEDLVESFDKVYGGNNRKIEHYRHVGLKKYKGNWGQSPQLQVGL
jgi:hypothetical protein